MASIQPDHLGINPEGRRSTSIDKSAALADFGLLVELLSQKRSAEAAAPRRRLAALGFSIIWRPVPEREGSR